jgi:integrase
MPPRLSGAPHNAGVARRRRRRGEGSVYRSQGSWIACYPLGVVGGRRLTKRKRCRSEREALLELEQMRRDYGRSANPSTATVGQWLTDWQRSHKRGLRDSTADNYAANIKLHIDPFIGGIPLARLQAADVRRVIDHAERTGLAAATIHKVITILRSALKAAVAEQVIPHSPAVGIRLPRIDNEPVRPVSHAEAEQVRVAVMGTWMEYVVRLLLGSGLRLGEAIGLNQSDLELDTGYVRLRKSKTRIRAVPISNDAVLALRQALIASPRRGPGEPVFFGPSKKRERMRTSSVSHALPRLLESHGLPRLTPHGLRHAAATVMLFDGVPMRVIAEQLGHRNPALTARLYAHVVPDQQRDAVRSLERGLAR